MMRRSSTAYPDRLVEWMFACMMIAWGTWLLAPWHTFDNPQYALLSALASENTWGVWSISVGVVRGVALWINGAYWRTPLLRLICAVLGVCWWMTLSYLFMSAPQPNPAAGISWYPIFIIFELISCWRSAADGWHTKAFRWNRLAGRHVGG